jgi:hypothetical protein
MQTYAPLEPVCRVLADLMTEHGEGMRHALRSLMGTRGDGRTYFDHVHTWFGPIRVMWDRDDERAIATLRLGPLPGGPGDNHPCIRGRSLLVRHASLAAVPQTLMGALVGRRLGEVAMFDNPFLERVAAERIVKVVDRDDHVGIELDMDLVRWTPETE